MAETKARTSQDSARPAPAAHEVIADTHDSARSAGPPAYEENAVEMLASKILVDWLRNRQQLLVPLTIDFQKLEPAQAQMLIAAAAAAALAEGTQDGSTHERAVSAIGMLGATEEQKGLLGAAIDRPSPLPEWLAKVEDVQSGALVYAVSLLAVDRRKLVNRYYLRYLAARLQLPKDLARSLEQRFRSG